MKKSSRKKKLNPDQTELFLDTDARPLFWPPNEDFPLNIPSQKRTVLKQVNTDIKDSDDYLIATGFTSLSHIIDSFGKNELTSHLDSTKIILGWEPNVFKRKTWGKSDLKNEIKDYWLEQGYSIFKGGNVIKIIELIKAKKIQFKILDHLHAKIYVGNKHVILGSANFSINGLKQQQEANIRIMDSPEGTTEHYQYDSIRQIAENFYRQGADYTEDIIKLLQQLLSLVSWQEALARAITELVDGNWFDELPELHEKISSISLWPLQQTSLLQAFYVLQNQGCVLIANPTGSGKTKLIGTLYISLFYWLWETGRKNKANALIICPPIVTSNWDKELLDVKFTYSSPLSMGLLSHNKSSNYQNTLKRIQLANILIIDEAHNYLNIKSLRSESISKHLSDYVILSTATPINKKAKDLLRLIEILDIDNLNDNELEQFKRLKKTKSLQNESDLGNLRTYIQKFMVRQTKNQIKEFIKHEPEKYINKFGIPCQYPEAINNTYDTGESEEDKEIANKINELADQLKGLLYLRKLEFSEIYQITEEQYLEMRLKAARSLSVFMIQAKLRSSKAAVVELIEGTKCAVDYFKFKSNKPLTGNFYKKINDYKNILPEHNLKKVSPPIWLVNEEEYIQACEKEASIYAEISNLSKKISDSREIAKIKEMTGLFKESKNSIIIAFDSTIITLDYLKNLIAKKHREIETVVVTGNTQRNDILQKFELGSKANNLLGLFSDSMSEGVNLQQASALFFLDMPSVLRIAEQRIGRIDRLDSPHKKINIFWPNDSDAFALKTDHRLLRTLADTEILIGSNFQIPDELMQKYHSHGSLKIIRPHDMQKDLEKMEQDDFLWGDMKDAFGAVHNLYDGLNPLIEKLHYEQLKNVNASVKCKLSILSSNQNWIFLAIRGNKKTPCQWYFIDSLGIIHFELNEICNLLRQHLDNSNNEESAWTEETTTALNHYLEIIQNNEIRVLPNKKRRALETAKAILEKLNSNKKTKHPILKKILELFKPASIDKEYSIDYYGFSQLWIDLFSPYLRNKRQTYKKRVISIGDLQTGSYFQEFTEEEMKPEKLQAILERAPYKKSYWREISACIIGIAS